eukprot:g14299.t1
MLKVAAPSNTSDSNSSTNSIPCDGDVDADGTCRRSEGRVRKKKRRWSVCAAKVKAGALKVRALVTSDSSSESEGGHEGDGDSESEMDSIQSERSSPKQSDRGPGWGFEEDRDPHGDHDHPLPRKGGASVVSFADAPSATAQAAHAVNANANANANASPDRAAPELCVVIPTPFDDGATTPSTTPTPVSGSAEGASVVEVGFLSPVRAARVDDGDGDGDGDGDSLARSSPGPLAGMMLIDSLAPGDDDQELHQEPHQEHGGGEEGGGEEGGGESTAWELSSSSGDDDDDTNVVSAIRSRSRSRSMSPPPLPSPSPPPVFLSPRGRSHTHTRPESPGSYVARMQRILAQVHQTTRSSTDSTSRSPDEADVGTARRTLTSGQDGGVMSGAAVGDGTLSSSDERAVRQPNVRAGPFEGTAVQHCRDEDGGWKTERQQVEQQRQGGLEQRGPCHAALAERTTQIEEEGVVYVDFEEPERRGDQELLIAAVSAMVGMMVPESYRWVLWLACSAVTVWFPLRNHFYSALGWASAWWSCAGDQAALGVDADQGPPPPYVEVDVDVDMGGGGDMHDGSPAGQVGVLGDETEQAKEGLGGGLDDDDLPGEREGAVARNVSKERKENEQYEALLAGLSETEVAFVRSAGEEEEMRLLHQCLEYANHDTAGAIKVCSTFCRFRMKEGWALVLSALELEGPLKSRVHTLTTGKDRIGRGLITFSPGKLDMKKGPPEAYHKMLCYVLQEVLKEEEMQTKGLVLLVDARDVGFGLLRHFTLADYTRGLRMLGGAFPAKVKAIRILHLNRAISIALSIAMPLLSPKMRARVEIVTSDRASDGSFTSELAEPSFIPAELGIQGKWTGSHDFWGKWVEERVSAERRLAR